MDGRVKTLHPEGARRPAGDPRQRRARGGDGGARHRADRSAGGQSLSVRGDGREGRRLRRLHREHRHRRPGDDPRRRQEPRRRRGGGRAGRLRARCSTSSTQHGGATTLALRKKLAAKAYARTAAYDAAISNWFANELGDTAPAYRAFGGKLAEALRYGENPHQSAAFYRTPEQRSGVATARQVQGKQLSYNNINDTDAAYECVAEFDPKRTAACAIIKHANPVRRRRRREPGRGLSQGAAPAIRSSAFGGIVALNRTLDAEAARAITEIFTEVIIAPDATDEAIAIVAREEEPAPAARRRPARSARRGPDGEVGRRRLAGAVARQRRGRRHASCKVVTKRAPTDAELRRPAVRLPRRQAREVEHHRLCQGRRHRRHRRRPDEPRSIPRASPRARREDAAEGAGPAEPLTKGSVVASDAFFPFADGLLVAIEAGATAVIQPGGSMRDDEVIKAADDARHRHGVHRHAAFPALRLQQLLSREHSRAVHVRRDPADSGARLQQLTPSPDRPAGSPSPTASTASARSWRSRAPRRGCARPRPARGLTQASTAAAPVDAVADHRRGEPALGVADRIERAVEREAVEIVRHHDVARRRHHAVEPEIRLGGEVGRGDRRRSASWCGRRPARCRARRRAPADSAMRRASASGTPASISSATRAARAAAASCGSALSSAAATAAMPSR